MKNLHLINAMIDSMIENPSIEISKDDFVQMEKIAARCNYTDAAKIVNLIWESDKRDSLVEVINSTPSDFTITEDMVKAWICLDSLGIYQDTFCRTVVSGRIVEIKHLLDSRHLYSDDSLKDIFLTCLSSQEILKYVSKLAENNYDISDIVIKVLASVFETVNTENEMNNFISTVLAANMSKSRMTELFINNIPSKVTISNTIKLLEIKDFNTFKSICENLSKIID